MRSIDLIRAKLKKGGGGSSGSSAAEKLKDLPGIWAKETLLLAELDTFLQRKAVCQKLIKAYNGCYDKRMHKLKAIFVHLTLEKSMARTLTKINDTQLTNKDKEILAHSKYAFKSITEQSQLGRIDFDKENYDKSEVENNIAKLNQICKNIKKVDSRIRTLEKNPTHTVDLDFQLKMKQSYVDDFLSCAESFLQILRLHNRKPIVHDTLNEINKRYENFLNSAHQEMNSSISSSVSKSVEYRQVPSFNSVSETSLSTQKTSRKTMHKQSRKHSNADQIDNIDIADQLNNLMLNRNEQFKKEQSRTEPSKHDKSVNDKFTRRHLRSDSIQSSSDKYSPNLTPNIGQFEDPKICYALCDFDGDDTHVAMREGEKIRVVKSDHTGMYTLGKHGQKKLIKSEFVELSDQPI